MLDSGRAMLHAAMKNLEGHWQGIEPHWQDQMARQFVEMILTPLKEKAAATLQASEQLEVLLNQMRRECGDSNNDLFSGS